ncbi:MAG: hypothetical protein GQ569_07665 [Methylococcaceae bacterium]|nr:hypothetical protein [Methylococcaceae bacterium]
MKYDYHDLYDLQFEQLVTAICSKLLGVGIQEFAKGRDGGRDALFHGRANCFPSESKPWEGKIVVQAKHTEGINCKFSDDDFLKNKSSIVNKEIPRIKNLLEQQELDFYMLFSNRKLPAEANTKIIKRISEETTLAEERISLIGIESLERYLKTYPDIPNIANINPRKFPLRVSPDELAEIILAFNRCKESFTQVIEQEKEIKRTRFDDKNSINGLSEEYAKILQEYIKDFTPIRAFLADMENESYLEMYQNSVEEFNLKIIAHREDYSNFDHILNHLYDLLITRDSDLRKHKKLTRTMLFYMYWNCDIGKNNDTSTD